MEIDYDHAKNPHTLDCPKVAIPIIFEDGIIGSVLDVGCGTGTWLKAAIDFGATDVFGIDGIQIQRDELHIDPKFFRVCNLTSKVDLGRKFDVVMCLEVAEHLEEKHAEQLIETLTKHSDKIIFSAACPGQSGQHHVNCQWPAYWQSLFNSHGFACVDSLRSKMWGNQKIQPWYQQNIFVAQRSPDAGAEPRIKSLMHPEIVSVLITVSKAMAFNDHLKQIENGCMQASWYLTVLPVAMFKKVKRKIV